MVVYKTLLFLIMKIEKAYNHQKNEKQIYDLWEKGGYFTPKIDPTKKPFVIIMPPPNANGVLHIGHAVFVTLQDIMVRYHRMRGVPTLWLPGFDHAGIATQVVFEKELAKQRKTRFDLGREEFFRRAFEFSMQNKKRMEDQLRKLGASCDWTREKFTLEKDITKAVYYTFTKMYTEGLIYRGERIINWCPRCQTALSDLEVDHQERETKLYFIKYPIVDSDGFVTVATTRPETMLGDTAVAVHPEDERYKNLLAKNTKLQLPLTQRIIPLIADERVDKEFGTGAVKVTPGHDPTDFEIGKAHKLPIINVIGKEGRMTSQAGKDYEGLTVKECRKKVLEDLKKLGLLEKEEHYKHSVAICERCKTVIEPLVSEQWFVKTKKLAQRAIEVVKKGEIKFIPKRFEKIYFHWMENIRDWCISRQIWWGQRIPVWYRKNSKFKNQNSKLEIYVGVEPPKGDDWQQDPDTLDTWFSSGQWPFTVFGWPKETEEFKYFYPTTVMETGWDILFFWVARMIMLGLYCTNKVPFRYVYLHGLVRDKYRQKMSKSKGNVIDPLGVIDLYGADALRMALVFGTGAGNDIVISEEKIVGQRKFTNKIWNAARFVLTQIQNAKFKMQNAEFKLEDKELTEADKKILEKLEETVKKVTEDLDNFRFHNAAQTLYQFFWFNFCDVYIEKSKLQIQKAKTEKDKEKTLQILLYVLLTSLKLLHPFMPFVTETIYQMLPFRSKKALIIEDWPTEKMF